MPHPCTAPCPETCTPANVTDSRTLDCFTRRFNAATHQAGYHSGPHKTNGDENYTDHCASYSKGILQDSPGIVNQAAFTQFTNACSSGSFADFENLISGGNRTQNDPMGSYAYAFIGADGSQFGDHIVAPPPRLESAHYATELIELYWCSLLRDVAFSDYATNPTAQAASNELSTAAHYAGPTDAGAVTPALLFRGKFAGEDLGPYTSQLFLRPTNFGAAPFPQQYTTYLPNIDYMTDQASWYAVQQGIAPTQTDQKDPVLRYLHNGRGFAAYTHVDELYQAYFTAYLVLNSIKASANPGNPYFNSTKQNGFGTFGGPDIASVLAQVAKLALNSVWYQKWVVHLRHRPEAGAGLVHLIQAHGDHFDGTPHHTIFASRALAQSYAKYGTYLLSQPFPEGSPTHPAYPTGHGAVGGACITILKFFFKGELVLDNPVIPSSDGTALIPWNGDPATGKPGTLTVNGELHKLAHNITFGHGLHGGIHWRSDSDSSMLLGEAVALQFLKDLACSYAEPFTITLTKLDGHPHTITNQ